MGAILKRQPRDLVLNLCQYGMGNVWEWGKEIGGQSWRTAGDLGGSFEGIPKALFRDGFDLYAAKDLHKFGGPGGWNDPDYLLLGYLSNWKGKTVPTPLTPNEQYSHVSLWCLLAAPLIFSGDMTRLDDFTLGLLCNDEVIDVDQDPLGQPGRRVAKVDGCEVWAKAMEDGTLAVGLFNRGEGEKTVPRSGPTWASPARSSSATSGGRKTWASSPTRSRPPSPATAWCWCDSPPRVEPLLTSSWSNVPGKADQKEHRKTMGRNQQRAREAAGW